MTLKHVLSPSITDPEVISSAMFFYTRKEAATYAASIGWPKKSARMVALPFGRVRFVVSDDHCNVILHEQKRATDD